MIGVQGAAIATAISSYFIYIVRKITVGQRIIVSDYWKVHLSWALIVAQAVVSIYLGNTIAELVLIGILVIANVSELRKMGAKFLNIKQILR